jgi:F0F1-type ATP synthase membrane subunit b/b'
MNTKLTLTLEKEIIEQAKKYASAKGKSLSEMVENYFRYLTEFRADESEIQLSSRAEALRGIVKVDADFDYKKILDEEKSKKYSL